MQFKKKKNGILTSQVFLFFFVIYKSFRRVRFVFKIPDNFEIEPLKFDKEYLRDGSFLWKENNKRRLYEKRLNTL